MGFPVLRAVDRLACLRRGPLGVSYYMLAKILHIAEQGKTEIGGLNP